MCYGTGILKKGGAGEGGKGRAFGLLVRSLTDRLKKRWIKKKKEKKKHLLAKFSQRGQRSLQFYLRAQNLNIRMGSNKSLYNIIQP